MKNLNTFKVEELEQRLEFCRWKICRGTPLWTTDEELELEKSLEEPDNIY